MFMENGFWGLQHFNLSPTEVGRMFQIQNGANTGIQNGRQNAIFMHKMGKSNFKQYKKQKYIQDNRREMSLEFTTETFISKLAGKLGIVDFFCRIKVKKQPTLGI